MDTAVNQHSRSISFQIRLVSVLNDTNYIVPARKKKTYCLFQLLARSQSAAFRCLPAHGSNSFASKLWICSSRASTGPISIGISISSARCRACILSGHTKSRLCHACPPAHSPSRNRQVEQADCFLLPQKEIPSPGSTDIWKVTKLGAYPHKCDASLAQFTPFVKGRFVTVSMLPAFFSFSLLDDFIPRFHVAFPLHTRSSSSSASASARNTYFIVNHAVQDNICIEWKLSRWSSWKGLQWYVPLQRPTPGLLTYYVSNTELKVSIWTTLKCRCQQVLIVSKDMILRGACAFLKPSFQESTKFLIQLISNNSYQFDIDLHNSVSFEALHTEICEVPRATWENGQTCLYLVNMESRPSCRLEKHNTNHGFKHWYDDITIVFAPFYVLKM